MLIQNQILLEAVGILISKFHVDYTIGAFFFGSHATISFQLMNA